MKSQTFALDYDDTFTADPSLWASVVRMAKDRSGHRFIMVTARRETEENIEQINADLDHWGCQMPIVFTALASKLDTVAKRGIKIDIWIDDDPESLVRGH